MQGIWTPSQTKAEMRPILKGNTRKRSPNKSTSSPSPLRKRSSTVQFSSPSGRRVTFSPFAKPRRRHQPPKRLQSDREENGIVTSGFAFSAADDREVKRAARRKRDLRILEILYKAASKPRLSWLSLVEDHLPFLKPAQVKISHLLRVIKEPFLAAARRRQNRRVLRSRTRHAPTVYFDPSDRQYVLSINAPLLPPTQAMAVDQGLRTIVGHTQSAIISRSPSHLVEPSNSVQPMLTPIHSGSLSSLLRKEGIPASEDESREQDAVRNDLRGVTHRSTGLKIVSSHHELRVV